MGINRKAMANGPAATSTTAGITTTMTSAGAAAAGAAGAARSTPSHQAHHASRGGGGGGLSSSTAAATTPRLETSGNNKTRGRPTSSSSPPSSDLESYCLAVAAGVSNIGRRRGGGGGGNNERENALVVEEATSPSNRHPRPSSSIQQPQPQQQQRQGGSAGSGSGAGASFVAATATMTTTATAAAIGARVRSLLRTASSLNDYAVDLHNDAGSHQLTSAARLFRQSRDTFVKSLNELDREKEERKMKKEEEERSKKKGWKEEKNGEESKRGTKKRGRDEREQEEEEEGGAAFASTAKDVSTCASDESDSKRPSSSEKNKGKAAGKRSPTSEEEEETSSSSQASKKQRAAKRVRWQENLIPSSSSPAAPAQQPSPQPQQRTDEAPAERARALASPFPHLAAAVNASSIPSSPAASTASASTAAASSSLSLQQPLPPPPPLAPPQAQEDLPEEDVNDPLGEQCRDGGDNEEEGTEYGENPSYPPMGDYNDDQYNGLGLYREETDDAHGGTVRFLRPLKMSMYYPRQLQQFQPQPPLQQAQSRQAVPPSSTGGSGPPIPSASIELAHDLAVAACLRGAAVASYNLSIARDRLLSSSCKSTASAVEALSSSGPSALSHLSSAAGHVRSIPPSCRTDRDRSLEVMIHNNAAGAYVEGGKPVAALRSLLRALRVEAPEKYRAVESLIRAAESDDDTVAKRSRGEERDEPSIVAAVALRITALHSVGLRRQNESNNLKARSHADPTVVLHTHSSPDQDREADDYLLRQSVTASNVGQIYFRSLRFSESSAAVLITDALRTAVLGPNHVLAASCKYNLGLILHRLGDPASAGSCYNSFLTAAEGWTPDSPRRLLDTDDNVYPVTERALRSASASARHQYGLVQSTLGDKNGAVASLLLVLYDRRALCRTPGRSHPDVAKTLFSLGQVLFECDRMAESSVYFEECLRTSSSLRLDPAHMIFVFSLSYLGQIRQRLGDTRSAAGLYDEALHLAQRAFGDTHYVVINLLNVLGNLRLRRGEMGAASRYFARASGMYVLAIMRGCRQILDVVRRQTQMPTTTTTVNGAGTTGTPAAPAPFSSSSAATTNMSSASASRALNDRRHDGEGDEGGAFVVVTTCRRVVAKAA